MVRRFLVTGGTGFIGRHIAGRLAAAGHSILAAGRHEVDIAHDDEPRLRAKVVGLVLNQVHKEMSDSYYYYSHYGKYYRPIEKAS